MILGEFLLDGNWNKEKTIYADRRDNSGYRDYHMDGARFYLYVFL